LLALVVGLGHYALATGIAGAEIHEASSEMEGWRPSGAQPKGDTVERVKASLLSARLAVPSSPAANELIGIIEVRTSVNSGQLARARDYYSQALAVRPTSPYTWANLVEVMYRTGDTGRSFEAALLNAARLGPFEPEVQRTVAFFGLAVWNEVPPAVQAGIEAGVASGMRRNPLEMLRIAERRGRLDVACRHLEREARQNDPKSTQLCQSVEATP